MITAHQILESPSWYPLQQLSEESFLLLKLDEAAYRTASFLDERLVQHGTLRAEGGTATIREAAAQLAPRAHFIFHTGHVGSTLISRLIGEHEHLFSVREPVLLRPLAAPGGTAGAARALDMKQALGLFSRTWRPAQRAVIKVTSFVGERADDILAMDASARAILMCTSALSYLRGILAGPNSRVESRMLAPARQARLATRLGQGPWQPDPRSEGEQVAMSWLCEMTALQQAVQRHPSRTQWVNFDSFLRTPVEGLTSILRTLGVTLDRAEIERLISGRLMRQYSKAPEHAYDTALRWQVLLSADHEHAPEIRRGMAWLERLAQRHELVRTVLASSQRGI